MMSFILNKEFAEKEIDYILNNLSKDSYDYENTVKELNTIRSMFAYYDFSSYSCNALERLSNGLPLSEIEGNDNEWIEEDIDIGIYDEDVVKSYYNERYYGLIKLVHKDGRITYTDVNRVECYDVNRPAAKPHYSAIVRNVIDEMFPIQMPYYPLEDLNFQVTTEEFDSFKDGVLYYVYGIRSCYVPSDIGRTKVTIDRYFRWNVDNGLEEIGPFTYGLMVNNMIDE